jgi:hypothetical protein
LDGWDLVEHHGEQKHTRARQGDLVSFRHAELIQVMELVVCHCEKGASLTKQ